MPTLKERLRMKMMEKREMRTGQLAKKMLKGKTKKERRKKAKEMLDGVDAELLRKALRKLPLPKKKKKPRKRMTEEIHAPVEP